jgi:hypothetical protein
VIPARINLRPVSLLAPLCLAVALVSVACGPSPAGGPVPQGALIVTQVPAGSMPAMPADRLDPDARYPLGSRIVVVTDPGQPEKARVLSQGLPRAGGPSLSPDGRRIVFAGSRTPQLGWTLFEAGVDGRRPVQILRMKGECIDPAYLPHGRLIFTCSERSDNPRVWALHTASPGGQEVTRITFGPGSAFDPTPLADGRVLFAMQQNPGPGRPEKTTGLFTINADGTMLAPYAGSHDGDLWKVRPRPTPDGGVVFISAGHENPGHLERVEMSRPMATRHRLAERTVLAAQPLPGGDLLVATWPRSNGPATASLFRYSQRDESMALLMSDPDHHLVEALMVISSEEPPERPSAVNREIDTATLVCYDAGWTDTPHGASSSRPFRLSAEMLAASGPESGAIIPLGQVPMAVDGSFHVEVPADRPLRMVAEDQAGERTTSEWFWLRPGEVRSCFGCHENRESAPPNRIVQALTEPAVTLPAKTELARGETP